MITILDRPHYGEALRYVAQWDCDRCDDVRATSRPMPVPEGPAAWRPEGWQRWLAAELGAPTPRDIVVCPACSSIMRVARALISIWCTGGRELAKEQNMPEHWRRPRRPGPGLAEAERAVRDAEAIVKEWEECCARLK